MKQTSERREREASAREKIRRMRASHRRNLIIVGVLFFAIGCVAGVFGQRWYDRTDPDAAQTVMPDITAEPVPAVTPEPEAPAGEGEPEGFFVEPGAEQPDDGAEIFPEADRNPPRLCVKVLPGTGDISRLWHARRFCQQTPRIIRFG